MSEMVLVATPARLSTPAVLLERASVLAARLTYQPRARALYLNEQADGGGKYRPNAVARNELIARFLRPEHDWVLWVDVDIIEYPADLVERLMTIARRHAGEKWPAIVAPMVWMERVGEGDVSLSTGGWFYDIGGFVALDGQQADFHAGPQGHDAEQEMASVGCVYLAPAGLYRQGLGYRPAGDEVEHLSFMRAARAAGATVIATRGVEVRHAYLPKYGARWNG